jgi:hypothetical protein
MSDKDRQKKDGRNKDKKNKAMHDRENDRVQKAAAPQQGKDASNLTDTQAGAATSNRQSKTRQK